MRLQNNITFLFLFVFYFTNSINTFAETETASQEETRLKELLYLDTKLGREIIKLDKLAKKHSCQVAVWRLDSEIFYISREDIIGDVTKTKFHNAVKEALLIREILEIDSTTLNQLYNIAQKNINNIDDSEINVKKIDIKNIIAIAYLKALLIQNEQESISFFRQYVNIIKKFQNAEQDKAMADKIMTDAKLQLTSDVATAVAMVIPLLGDAIDIYNITTGEDAITGEKLSRISRGFNAFMLLSPNILGIALKKNPALAKKLENYYQKLAEKSTAMTGPMAKKASAVKNKIKNLLKKESTSLSKALKSKHDDMLRALNGSDREILELYRNGGMKNLSKLEQLGKISKEEADRLNDVLSKHVDNAIDTGTRKTMQGFQDQHNVKIKKVWQGDSGSSAMGQSGRSVNTDADRTFIVDFDEKDLKKYADEHHKGNIAQAQEELQREFCDQQKQITNQSLQTKTRLTKDDVGYEVYSGLGNSGGHSTNIPADTYPTQITQVRQTQGKTTIYEFDADGTVKSQTTSGEALTDHHALKNNDTQVMQQGGPKMVPQESRGVIDQQMQAIMKQNLSPEKAAKALLRADKAASILKLSKVNPHLKRIAIKLRGSNPQAVYQSMSKEQLQNFVEEVKDAIRKINEEEK